MNRTDNRDIGIFMKRSITKQTLQTVQRKMGYWDEYYDRRGGGEGRQYMQDYPNDDARVDRVMHFAAWLHGVKELVGKPLTTALGALRTTMETKGLRVGFWDDARVVRVRRAARPNTEETRKRLEERPPSTILPMTEGMVYGCRKILWKEWDWTAGQTDRKARWLAIALGFDSGSRIGQLVLTEKGKENHTLRARDVSFVMEDGMTWVGGVTLRRVFARQGKEKVAMVEFAHQTGKTSRMRGQSTLDVKTIMRRTPIESQVVDDLCDWVMNTGVKEGDEFLTRYHAGTGARKVVTRKEVGEAIKLCAETLELPSQFFSTKSLRKGFASHCEAVKVPEEDRNKRGSWAVGSKVPQNHYVSTIGAKGGLALMDGEEKGITGGEIKRLVERSYRRFTPIGATPLSQPKGVSEEEEIGKLLGKAHRRFTPIGVTPPSQSK